MPLYMEYDTIKGDVTAEGHEGWIELNSFQWGLGRGISSPTGAAADRESAAPSVSEITVTKAADISSPAAERGPARRGQDGQDRFLQDRQGEAESSRRTP